LLAEALGAVLTREPGGTALGRAIRHILLGPDFAEIDDRAEALLLVADRAQHVADVVLPALTQGRDVVTDRFSGSTLAYQGWGRGLDAGWLSALSVWASRGVEPDLFVLLDVDPEVAASRRCGNTDRMERSGDAFHRRVLEGYRSLAEADPRRWVVVDGSGPVEVVAVAVRAAVSAHLAQVS
jgi:dTMP kinase